MDRCGVYMIECAGNGQIYIGSSHRVHARWYAHRYALKRGRHASGYLQRSWDKYGEDSFRLIVIEECERERLLIREQAYLDAFHPAFNVCPVAGSRIGVPHSEDVREKIRLANTGKKRTPEQCERIRVSRAGIAMTKLRGLARPPEVGEKVRAALTGRKRSPETIEKMRAAMLGRHASSETRAALSAARLGHPVSAETRALISAAVRASEKHRASVDSSRGVPRPPEVREKIAAALRGRTRPELRGVPRSTDVRAKISATKRAKRLAQMIGA